MKKRKLIVSSFAVIIIIVASFLLLNFHYNTDTENDIDREIAEYFAIASLRSRAYTHYTIVETIIKRKGKIYEIYIKSELEDDAPVEKVVVHIENNEVVRSFFGVRGEETNRVKSYQSLYEEVTRWIEAGRP